MERDTPVSWAATAAFARIRQLSPAALIAFAYALASFATPPALSDVLYTPAGGATTSMIVTALGRGLPWSLTMTLATSGGVALYLLADVVAISASTLMWATGLYLTGYASLSIAATALATQRRR